MRKYYQGIYKVKNREKYKGNPDNVIYRSSWEAKVFFWLDNNPNVLSWGSEEFFIPYLSPVDKAVHRYFPDVIVNVKTQNGKTKIMVLEIKPENQTQPPKPKKRITEGYKNEIKTFAVNTAKWKAAEEFCLDRGWEFKIITEKHLGI
jgi:hypothetical protein